MTQEEKNTLLNSVYSEINTLKARLSDTDYIGIKIAEGAATKAEYADICEQRQGWRDNINALEAEIAELEAVVPCDEDNNMEG